MISFLPLVSICIPTYNHEGYIDACIEGVLSQQVDFPIEIIIGEDDSSDKTRNVCEAYAAKYPDLIRLFLRERSNNIKIFGKPTGRFNFTECLRAARGKYVAICEGDDEWTDKTKLAHQVAVLEADDEVNVCYHNVVHNDESGGEFTTRFNEIREKRIFRFEDSVQAKNGVTLSVLYRSAALNVDELLNYTLHSAMADWPLECLLTRSGKGVFLPRIMGKRNLLSTGATANRLNRESFYRSRYNFLDAAYESFGGQQKMVVSEFLYRLSLNELAMRVKNRNFLLLPTVFSNTATRRTRFSKLTPEECWRPNVRISGIKKVLDKTVSLYARV